MRYVPTFKFLASALGLVALLLVAGPAAAQSNGGGWPVEPRPASANSLTCEPPGEDDALAGDSSASSEFDETVMPAPLGASAAAEAAAQAEQVSDGSKKASDAEMDQFRAASERYGARVEEFANQVSSIVLNRYEAEVAELKSGYDTLITQADLQIGQLRGEAIKAHEAFLQDHPDSVYTPRRIFRLAELYFEQSEEQFLLENEQYDELVNLFEAGEVEFLPEPPLKDYRKSIALYKRIIRDHPTYEELGAVYYMLGYTYSDDTSKHLDPERAEQTYLDLLANVPSSPYRAQAYFRLGDLYFEENRNQRALAYYHQIVDEFQQRGTQDESGERLYQLALYKLAWAYYKIDDLSVAAQRFMELLDWAQDKEERTGREADLKPESIRYLAISLVDLATEQGAEPVDYALSSLASRSEEAWVFPVLVELADILREQARFDEAIVAYRRLQELQPNNPLGPEFQYQIIVLYQNLIEPDPDGAAQARVDLTRQYGLDSEWYQGNKNNKEATTLATGYILDSLERVAASYHAKAQETGDPEDYLQAVKAYLEFLDRYPFAQNAYQLNYLLADAYYWIGGHRFQRGDGEWTTGWQEAIAQYAHLFGFPETEYREQAILGIMFSYNYLWKQTAGDITAVPTALANIKPALGETPQYERTPLTELEKNYIRSVRWVQREVPNFDGMAVLLYDIGQTYYYKNHLVPARAVFEELITSHPSTDEASFSAGLIFDSWRYTGNLGKMREAGERFASMNLGKDQELASLRNEVFIDLARKSLFKEGEVAYGASRFECALLSFLDYYDQYGSQGTDKEPQENDLVIYNIAQSFSKIGKTEESNDYFELLLRRFPHSEQAPATFWKMASNYERVLELEKAVRYYQDLVKFHPGHEDVVNAFYNQAFLLVGLKRFEEAARAYEAYHSTYPEEEDAKALLFRAAQTWEIAGSQRDSVRVYEEWLDLYGEDDADRWVETQKKLAEVAFEERRPRNGQARLDAILDSYATIRQDLIEASGIGLRISAELAFEPLLADFGEYEALKFPNTQNAEELQAVLNEKLEWNERIKKNMDAYVVQFPDWEWQSAALYYKARAYQNHGITWMTAPIPFDPDKDDEFELYDIYIEKLTQQAQPFEDTAMRLYQEVVKQAKDKKRHTDWVTKALQELSRLDPLTYPVPKPESTTVIPSDALSLPPAVDKLPQTSSRPIAPSDRRVAVR